MGVRVEENGSVYNGVKVNTPYTKDDKGVKVDDFLNLMVAQLTNQDFMNPVDDTQYVTQLAQFATMQSMQEMSGYSQLNYVSSLVGKTVTVASLGLGGNVAKDTGVVSAINLSGDNYTITVNGKQYELSQIMTVNNSSSDTTKEALSEANKIALVETETQKTQVSLRWDPPVENSDDLTYSVYYTEDGSHDMSTISGVKQGKIVAADLADPSATITGLEPGKTYFVNVVVKNANGDQAIYQAKTITTLSES